MKSLKIGLLCTILFASFSSHGLLVSAAEEAAQSDSHVMFYADDSGTTTPIDPTDPSTSVTPSDTVSPSQGALRIDYASQISFGEQQISGSDKDYYALLTEIQPLNDKSEPVGPKKYVAPYVQVTDNRGANSGWQLSLASSPFKTTDGEELRGAQLSLSNAQVNSVLPTSFAPAVSSSSITLSNTPQNILTANTEKGMGTWTNAFGNNTDNSEQSTTTGIKLHVPAESKKLAGEKYQSTLTWILSDTP
ncbi:WxL domain-containing protein [Listeria booriae]|uniref:WxL domain-containing protein n=1 Tax=Listeria booriae TaxID=1552123 RepID=UPI001624916B|nr:WxL domain-containing protein [Listeria booriae]MBC2098394.1 WxL domain-containing protein [Listeria booriae]